MQKAVKTALFMHLGLIDTSPICYPPCSEDIKKFYSSSQFHISLSEEDEKENAVIKYIHDIPKGFRNSYCKNLTRYYLKTPTQFIYSENKIFF